MPETKPNPYSIRLTARFTVLLDPATHEWVMQEGGGAFVRDLIKAAQAAKKKERKP